MVSRLVIAFLPRSKCLLISWLQSPSAVILEPKKIKSDTFSNISPSICHEVMGQDAMILVFWMLSFKPTFSLSPFTFIKRLFNSSLLSAIRVVPSAYLRLLIFLLAILIPWCSMSSSNCCFFNSIQISQEAGYVVWYSHLFQNFPQFIVIQSQRLCHSQESRNRCFSGTLLLFPWSSGYWQLDLWFFCLF